MHHLYHVVSLRVIFIFFNVRFYHCTVVHCLFSLFTCTFVTCDDKYQSINKSINGGECRISKAELSAYHSLWQQGTHAQRQSSPSTWNFGPNSFTPFKNAHFQSIFARSSVVVRPSEKVQLLRIESNTDFLMSQRRTTYVAPKLQRGSKTKSGRFSSKMDFSRRKSATKFLYVKTFSEKVVRHTL